MSLITISNGWKFCSRMVQNHKANCNSRMLSKVSLHENEKNTTFQPGQAQLLMDVLGCENQQAYRLLNRHKTLTDMDRSRLEKAVAMCKTFGIDKEEIIENADVLVILAPTIQHHSMLLQECGFTNIRATSLINYIPLIKKRLSLLRAYGYIPEGVDVGAHIISRLTPAPPIEPVPAPPDACIYEVHTATLRRYLAWRLEASDQQLDAKFKTYTRLRHKSLRLVQRSLALLEEDLGFSREKILKNAYLIHSQPENTERILKEVATLGGVPVREVISKHPKIVMTACDTLINTTRHLQEFGLSDEAVRRCPDVFTLSSSSVRTRLEQLRAVPEFNALGDHPRILRLVHYQRKAKSRLQHLQEMRVKCASLHILSAPVSLFEKYTREGADKTKGMDVTRFISVALDEDEQAIRRQMVRHVYWCHVPLLSVKQTLDLLLELRFTRKQIFNSVHILLYPKERVEEELNNLSHHPELQPGNLIPLSRGWKSLNHDNSSSSDSDDERMDVDRRLDYALYFMEREHHFTGDAVWPKTGVDTIPVESTVQPDAPLA